MKTYELTYIISSAMTQEDAGAVAKEIETFIQSKEGVILKSEKTGAQTLAYPVKKQSSGYFCILEFQTAENTIKEIKGMLEKDTKILRHFMLIKRPVKIMKERRTRKPLFTSDKEPSGKPVLSESKEKKAEKLNPVDLDKKLDEILSE
ncbi:MAG: 30S ribosomal protein S6 [Candidatus Staskawiczbacteria bacterium]|nr:30S ribosomal protein S6 [Candidatus Staskawiczbacteria bacterium]